MKNGFMDEMAMCLTLEKTFGVETSWNGETIMVSKDDLSITLKQVNYYNEPFWTIVEISAPEDNGNANYWYDYLERVKSFGLAVGDWLYSECFPAVA